MGMKISYCFLFELLFLLVMKIVRGNPVTNNPILNGTDAERYFTVETSRGYIVINREYEYTYLEIDYLSICLSIALKIN